LYVAGSIDELGSWKFLKC